MVEPRKTKSEKLLWIKSFISDIRSVLLNDWDPIGVGDIPGASDEYDRYIGPIMGILAQKPSVEAIAALLEEIEKQKWDSIVLMPNIYMMLPQSCKK